jgi:periplasmic divalent cation tolerance protein
VPGHVEIQVTCGSREEAEAIADDLVERRLAACVHLLPIRSTYRWAGAIQHDEEILLVAKTRAELADVVQRAVLKMHSYEVPAITIVALAGGSPAYLDWVDAETQSER